MDTGIFNEKALLQLLFILEQLDAKVCPMNVTNRHDSVGFDLVCINIVNNRLPFLVAIGQVVKNLVYHPLGGGPSGFEFEHRNLRFKANVLLIPPGKISSTVILLD